MGRVETGMRALEAHYKRERTLLAKEVSSTPSLTWRAGNSKPWQTAIQRAEVRAGAIGSKAPPDRSGFHPFQDQFTDHSNKGRVGSDRCGANHV